MPTVWTQPNIAHVWEIKLIEMGHIIMAIVNIEINPEIPMENDTKSALFISFGIITTKNLFMVDHTIDIDACVEIIQIALNAYDTGDENDYSDMHFNDDESTDYAGTYVIAQLEYIKMKLGELK